MNDLATLLSDEQLERLDRFPLDRVDEDAVTADLDEGVLDRGAGRTVHGHRQWPGHHPAVAVAAGAAGRLRTCVGG